MKVTTPYDVAIVGAGIAGSTTALLYAQKGLRVALIEKQRERGAYKRLCTHFLQPSAVPVLKKLGLYREVLETGGVHSTMRLRTRWGAFNVPHPGTARGINIRRALLDPLLRERAARHPMIDLYAGYKVTQLLTEKQEVIGFTMQDDEAEPQDIHATLTVAADGRHSSIAKLAGVPTVTQANERFSYYAYYRHLPRYPDNNTQVWLVGEGQAYVAAFPQNNDLTLVSCYVPEKQFHEWQGQAEARYQQFVADLDNGPPLGEGERVGELMGMRKAPSVYRRPTLPGLALVGDAALAIDPLAGIGCSWAMISATQLVNSTHRALHRHPTEAPVAGTALARALQGYRLRHNLYFWPQFWLLSRFSRAKRYHPITRGVLLAAVKLFGGAFDRQRGAALPETPPL
ncbi:NAD(P)/FAD-dependent oxidoreductase [Mangrovitalea sediminis]|uniref:NAD(P)/FAD-dependent oxidoreductase n=1 Tax=Mangrovitalea sediminis TaxID=1982043 RepID=UPI000BE59A62|nr:NAD(P)/FAD-dependent oxidoreductase [Mangrovitalea sediminis]